MIVIVPKTITDTELTSSTIPEPDTGEVVYSAATNYVVDDEVISTTTHNKYKAAAANGPQTPVDPDGDDGTTWINIGKSNRYAMFDTQVGTQSTTTTSPLVVELTPGSLFNGLSGFNITGAETINVTVDDPVAGEVYNTDLSMIDLSEKYDFYNWFFSPIININRFALTDLPPYPNATATITITGSGTIGVGGIMIGSQVSIGDALQGTSLNTRNNSRVERDEFGNFSSITQRRKSRDRSYRVGVLKSRFDYVDGIISELSGATTPSVWIADQSDPATITYGFPKESIMTYASNTYNEITIDVESTI